MQSKPNQPCLCFWANKPSLEHLQVRSLVWQGLLQRSQDPTWHALKHFSSKGLGCYAKSSCDREETGRDEMFWLSVWWKWAFSFLASRRLLTRWSPKCMSELVSSERKTVLVFDWFFMRFVQRVTHVQNMSTSVYYGGLCVLPRRMFSLFPWIWQNLLLSVEMFVQKMEGRKQSGYITFFPSLHTRTLRPLIVVFCIKSNLDGNKQPRRSTGTAHHFRATGATGARDFPQNRMSPTALSPLKLVLGLSMGDTGSAARSWGDGLAIPWFWDRELWQCVVPKVGTLWTGLFL